ncbi:hypothetical protein A8U91_00348 [Halomonas elongata]|uniref:ABC transmembrane type-1 domain-containing protein n=1 Tax=Halomonas elongata TaxID=2746 RepID=A0A1B8P186_HALEL|nr:hypothetical protein [Halomonas elongata]OBX36012.1 hypothetical protein A8U91_00348 [Halomonas elongata]
MLLLFPALAGLRTEWQEAASLLGAGRLAYWRHIGLPVLWPALLGTLTILIANAMGLTQRSMPWSTPATT